MAASRSGVGGAGCGAPDRAGCPLPGLVFRPGSYALLLRYSGAFQIWVDWKRAGRNDFRHGGRRASALPGVQDVAASLPGQITGWLRVVRTGVRAESRDAGGRIAAPAFGHGAGGPELLGVPFGNGAGKTG